MNTDTPRTDAAAGHAMGIINAQVLFCSRQLEREITEIRNALGDDGRRTHRELLELAFKASGWKLWKEKYIDLKNAHIAEGQDPDGTIWEHADKLQRELKASKSEVERLDKERRELSRELHLWEMGNYYKPKMQSRIDELQAEVERLRSILENLTDAVTRRLSDDFQPEAARQLWDAFKVASKALDNR